MDCKLKTLRSLINTFKAHHKFATLSSNNPRATGNTRCIICKRSSIEVNQGNNNRLKVIMTVTPS